MKTDKGILSTYRIVLVLGVWSLVMTSCGNENKSISEPLSLDERNELINGPKQIYPTYQGRSLSALACSLPHFGSCKHSPVSLGLCRLL